jgi:hypothetical protein
MIRDGILFDSKVFDPAYVMGLGLWSAWNDNIQNQRTDIVSAYERMENNLVRTLERNAERILAIE